MLQSSSGHDMANLFTSICSSSFNFSPCKRAPCFSHLLELHVYLRFPILLLSFPTIPSTALRSEYPFKFQKWNFQQYLLTSGRKGWIPRGSLKCIPLHNPPETTLHRLPLYVTELSSPPHPPNPYSLSIPLPPPPPGATVILISTIPQIRKVCEGFHTYHSSIFILFSLRFSSLSTPTHCTGIWIPLKIKKLNF